MPDQNSIAVQLGREELVTLLSLMGIKSLAGLGDDYLSDFTDREQEILLSAGANALRAKGWLQESTNSDVTQVQIDGTLLALIGACAMAPRLLFLNYLPVAGPPRPWYVHLGEHLTVIHRTTLPGVHELWSTVEVQVAVAEIGRLLQLEAVSYESKPTRMSLTQHDFDGAMSLLQADGRGTAIAYLVKAGLAAEESELLLTAVTEAKANSTISLLAMGENSGEAAPHVITTFSLFSGNTGLWRLDTEETAVPSRLIFTQLSIVEAKSQLEAILMGANE